MRLTIAAFGLMLTACYSNSDGISPPLDKIYFPVGLSTDCNPHAFKPTATNSPPTADTTRPPDATACKSNYLYVVSSDFDLQYNAGSIQVLNLEAVRNFIPRECSDDSDCAAACQEMGLNAQSPAERATVPGPCQYLDLERVEPITGKPTLHDWVGIGAFATDGILRYAPEGTPTNPPEDGRIERIETDLYGNPQRGRRLLVPVRGEASLHWIDIRGDGTLACGQSSGDSKASCNHKHRVGTDAAENTRNVRMPAEPFSIATSDAGDAILVTHQTQGSVSLFSQDIENWYEGPKLEYVQTVSAQQPLAVAAIPEPELVRAKRGEWLATVGNFKGCLTSGADPSGCAQPDPDPYPPGFLVAYGNAAQIDLLRYMSDVQASVARPYLQGGQAVAIRANAADTNSRGIAFDDTKRRECDAACLSTDSDCLERCAKMSSGVYVTSRSPASLLVGITTPASADIPAVTAYTPPRDTPQFFDVMPLSLGPSRIYVGKIVNEEGELETRLFVVCYDERRVVIYDPAANRVEAFIKTGRGPHAMAFDYYDPGKAARDNGASVHALAYVGHFFDSYVGVIELDRRKIRTYGNIVLNLAQAVAPRASN